ncbi:phage tail protein [Rhizobium sp. SGZ-381]|uniref:phage tail protein n=1 Tax=Rhizobium sp. SGZ-381 TaxID=3342800 RepID=UPI0036722215
MINVKTLSQIILRGLAASGTMATLVASGGVLSMTTASPALACSPEDYIGSICIMAGDFCPRGYVEAKGQTVEVNQNQALFSILGYRYGTQSNPNMFTLPDLRGRSPIGSSPGPGPGLNTAVNLAAKVGAQQIFLNPTQVPVSPHTHPATFTGTGSGTKTVDVPAQAGTLAVSAKLIAKQTQGVQSAVNGAFLGQGSATGATQAPIYVPAALVAGTAELGGLDVQLTGTPGSPKITFDVPVGITGGTVAVGPNLLVAPTTAVSTQSPGLGLTMCIVTDGLYPPRP